LIGERTVAFTIEDFKDLIDLLEQHPEWRAELRRHVLSDDLLEIPALVRQLVEAQARSESRLDRIEVAIEQLIAAQAQAEARLERVETRLEGVEGRLERVETRLEGVEGRLDRVEVTLRRHTDQLGKLDGRTLEIEYASRAPSYFSQIARRLHVIPQGALAEILDDAVDDDQLSLDERDEILRADLIMSGRRRPNGQDVYLLAEISVGVGPHDVERAVTRATLLAKLGKPVLPIVAGESITEQAAAQARKQDVWYAEGGRVVPPQGA
jgi:hypothetical protein